MELYQIDDDARLFISAVITAWRDVEPYGIDVVVDLEGGLDLCIPTESNTCIYVYFPFDDDDQALPSMTKLQAIAELAAALMREGHRVLTHCSMGFNRSGLLAGMILKTLGMDGQAAVARIRERRPGALYNDRYVEYLIAE